MTTMTIYYGKANPIKAVGKHQCKLLDFAHTYKGWHTFNTKDKDTVRAVHGLYKRGCLEVIGDQFRFVYP